MEIRNNPDANGKIYIKCHDSHTGEDYLLEVHAGDINWSDVNILKIGRKS